MKVLPCLSAALLLGAPSLALAHLTYGGGTRDFGAFSNTSERSVTLINQSSMSHGWADGTDADFAKQDNQRYYRFTLQGTTTFTVSVTAIDPLVFLPAFSIYSGLGHAATDTLHPDFDDATTTQAYLQSLGAPAREGAFDALHTWQIGNNDDPANSYIGSLITLIYMDNAADGTSANYGSAAGINGDGVADGTLTKTFTMPAGDYTMAIAGANYANQSDATARGFNVTVSAVPEPSSAWLLASGLAALAGFRRRR